MKVIDALAGILKSSAPSADWFAGGVDRAQELARVFEAWGIVDLSKLQIVQRDYVRTYWDLSPKQDGSRGGLKTEPDTGIAFSYDGRVIGFLGVVGNDGAIDKRPNDFNIKVFEGTVFAWSALGNGNVSYRIGTDPRGAFMIYPAWGSSSDWGEFRQIFRFYATAFLSVVAPTIGFNAGTSLGTAIVSESFALAYPTLTTTIGNVAISTAMNGGDIEKAVERAALSYVGAEAGGFVGAEVTNLTDMATLGKVAAVATRAFITGADPRFAVAGSLIMAGGAALSTPAFYDPLTMAPDFLPIPDIDFQTGDFMLSSSDLISYDAPPAWDLLPVPTVEFTDQVFDPLPYGDAGDDAEFLAIFGNAPGTPFDSPFYSNPVDLPLIDYSMPPAGALFPVPSVLPGENALFSGPNTVIGVITAAATSALRLVEAYQKTSKPIQATARRVAANGSIEVANRDGLIHTQTRDGRITKRRPPVGEATATIDNSLIVNNGDGTYTLISPNGAILTQRYPANTSSGGFGSGFDLQSIASPDNLKLAAIAVGAFVLARKFAK